MSIAKRIDTTKIKYDIKHMENILLELYWYSVVYANAYIV